VSEIFPEKPGVAPGEDVAALHDLVRDILQSLPDTADDYEWRDRAGRLHVCDPDGRPYRAWTEDQEDEMRAADARGPSPAWVTDSAAGVRDDEEDDDPFAADRPDPHRDLDAGENGGAMTDGDFYDRTAGAGLGGL
jgi:hypothetical protein